jgi:RHS repeat-associated protein
VYDANGNRTSANGHSYGTPGAGNRLLNDGVFTYAYDNEGNEILRTRISGGYQTTYTWDYRNRLTRVQSNDGGSVDVQFTYDVFDRRIGKLSAGTQLWTAYSGDNAYADFTGSSLTSRYLYGDGIDQLFARLNANPVAITWYLTDNLGSVRQLVDNAGTVQDTVTYGDSYGNSPSDSGTGDRFKFTGREYDSETGLYYYRARYYDPAIARFLSQDPLGFNAGDSNLYRYVRNGPTNATDAMGLQFKGGFGYGGMGGDIIVWRPPQGPFRWGCILPGFKGPLWGPDPFGGRRPGFPIAPSPLGPTPPGPMPLPPGEPPLEGGFGFPPPGPGKFGGGFGFGGGKWY